MKKSSKSQLNKIANQEFKASIIENEIKSKSNKIIELNDLLNQKSSPEQIVRKEPKPIYDHDCWYPSNLIEIIKYILLLEQQIQPIKLD